MTGGILDRYVLRRFASFYGLALLHHLLRRLRPAWARGPTSIAYYFCLGNLGTLLGLRDFLLGKEVARWDPRKGD